MPISVKADKSIAIDPNNDSNAEIEVRSATTKESACCWL